MHALCGGHGLILWSLFGFSPVWVRTYRALPGNKDKNVKTIADTFNLDIDTPEAAESFSLVLLLVYLMNVKFR